MSKLEKKKSSPIRLGSGSRIGLELGWGRGRSRDRVRIRVRIKVSIMSDYRILIFGQQNLCTMELTPCEVSLTKTSRDIQSGVFICCLCLQLKEDNSRRQWDIVKTTPGSSWSSLNHRQDNYVSIQWTMTLPVCCQWSPAVLNRLLSDHHCVAHDRKLLILNHPSDICDNLLLQSFFFIQNYDMYFLYILISQFGKLNWHFSVILVHFIWHNWSFVNNCPHAGVGCRQ